MPESDRHKPDLSEHEQLLELELIQKRAAWQQAKARRGSWRALSFFFLFAVIVATLLTYFFLLSAGPIFQHRRRRSRPDDH